MKSLRMLVLSLRGRNQRFCPQLGCQDETPLLLAVKVFCRGNWKRNDLETLHSPLDFRHSLECSQLTLNFFSWTAGNQACSLFNGLFYGTNRTRATYRVRTLFQKQISRTFPVLFQDSDWFFKGSKIHFGPYTPKISMLILLTTFHTLHIF